MVDSGQVVALLVALLLVTSGGAVDPAPIVDRLAGDGDGTAAPVLGGDGSAIGETDLAADLEREADAVYVSESGDAVLVYERSHDPAALATTNGELGIETGTGLVHALYAGEFASADGNRATGNVSVLATPSSVVSTGDLTVPDAGNVESLSADATVNHTRDRSTASVDLVATVADGERFYSGVETEGDVTVDGSTLSASGSVRTTVADGAGNDTVAIAERRDVAVSETDDGFRLEAVETRSVGDWDRDRWETAEDALTTLENQYLERAILLGGTADVALETHDFTEGTAGGTVDLAYAVEFTGVEAGLAERLVEELQSDPDVDLDENEARVIADRIAALRVDEVAVSVDQRGLETDAEWTVEIDDYDEVILGLVAAAESIDGVDDDLADRYDEVREAVAARNAAELVRTTAWDVTVENADGRTTIDAAVDSTTRNWAAYVAELDDRGVDPLRGETTLDADAETVADGIDVRYEYETADDALSDATVEAFVDRAERANRSDEVTPGFETVLATVRGAEFEVARATVVADETAFRIETAAAVENATIDGIETASGDAAVTALHVDTETGATTAYVTVQGFVSEPPTESEVRDRFAVGPDTDVYMPGEWDREFPSIDHDAVRTFLGTSDDGDDAPSRTGGIQSPSRIYPIGAALLAVLAAGAVYAYRRE